VNRKDSLKRFYREVVEPETVRIIEKIDVAFSEEYQKIFDDFFPVFQTYLHWLKDRQEKENTPAIEYLHISWLKTSIPFDLKMETDTKFAYLLEAYSGGWYADLEEHTKEWHSNWLVKYVAEYSEKLLKKSRKYFGVQMADVRNHVYKLYPVMNRYLLESLRRGLRENNLKEWLKELETEKECFIRMGEYFDYSEVLVEINENKSTRKQRKLLQQKLVECGEFQELKYINQDISKSQFCYGDFTRANLTGCNLEESILLGANFKNATLNQVNFKECILGDCCFEHASLKGANFRLCRGGRGNALSEIPCFFGVNFREADLSEADFRTSNFNGADFTGAKMTNTKMMRRDKERLNLSNEQINQISWC